MKIKLNPDAEIVNTIKEGLKKTGRKGNGIETICSCR